MSVTVNNERVKMLGLFFNNLGVAAIVGGALIPLMPEHSSIEFLLTLPIGGILAFGSATLAQVILRDFLQEERNEILFRRRGFHGANSSESDGMQGDAPPGAGLRRRRLVMREQRQAPGE
jgi:hypothetical protein